MTMTITKPPLISNWPPVHMDWRPVADQWGTEEGLVDVGRDRRWLHHIAKAVHILLSRLSNRWHWLEARTSH